MAIVDNETLTPRESYLLEHEKDENERSREHAVRLKELELELAREEYKARIELKKLESKWASWLRLPRLVLSMPVLVVLAIGYIIDSVKNQEPSKHFWRLFE